jgi:hypothetical protein
VQSYTFTQALTHARMCKQCTHKYVLDPGLACDMPIMRVLRVDKTIEDLRREKNESKVGADIMRSCVCRNGMQ